MDSEERSLRGAPGPRRSRQRWAVALAAAVVAVAAGMGSWFLFAGDGEDPVAGDPDQPAVESDLAETTQVVDAWVAAWEADDADAVAALFTEDGVYSEPNGSYEGRDAIRRDALSSSRHAGNHQRTAELSSTGTGSFIFPFEFDFQGDTWIGEAEIELDGDLISRLEILSREIEG